jgi:arsenite transporter
VARLSTVDRFLPLWIGLAMAGGLLLGRLIPGLANGLNAVSIHGTSLPIAIGLLLMMYPVLAKVRYREIGRITADRRMIAVSLILNWIIGPAVMFALAWLLLPDLPAYRTGVILVGLARCIAMVLIWTDLACGDREMAAVLVALNAVFQVLAYAGLGVFYLNVLPAWLHLPTQSLHVSFAEIAVTVVVFLGIPLVAGFLTRTLGERARGQEWYESVLLPRIGPIALYGLLFTVVVLFALQGKTITSQPVNVARIALPLLVYFAVMWVGGFVVGRWLRPHDGAGVLRGQQRFRAGDCRRHRRIRRHVWPSLGRGCRPPHRGTRAPWSCLRGLVVAPLADVAASTYPHGRSRPIFAKIDHICDPPQSAFGRTESQDAPDSSVDIIGGQRLQTGGLAQDVQRGQRSEVDRLFNLDCSRRNSMRPRRVPRCDALSDAAAKLRLGGKPPHAHWAAG